MFDPETPSARAACAEYDRKRTRELLLKLAFFSTRSVADAEDLVQTAFLRLLDVEDLPWLGGTFLTHMSHAMRDTWKEKLRRRSATERPDEGVTAGDRSFAPGPPPDGQAHRARTLAVHRSLGERLLDRIRGKHPLAARVFELACDGVDEPADQAAALGVPVEQVYEAQRVLKRNGEQIKQQWEQSEEIRMAKVRAAGQERTKDEEKSG